MQYKIPVNLKGSPFNIILLLFNLSNVEDLKI